MRRRIFWGVFAGSVITMILTAAVIIGVIYSNSVTELKKEVRSEAVFVSEALNKTPENTDSYLSDISKNTDNRITLIRFDGTVLFDNYANPAKMENHSSRSEVVAAKENGVGDSSRYSHTLRQKDYYYAVKLSSGNIIRIANTTSSAFGIIGNAAGLSLLLAVYVLIAGIIIANILTTSFLRPLNHLDLDNPLKNETYEELSPLLRSLDKKNRQIASQIRELSERQQEFKEITSSMSEGLVIFNSQGNILSANKSALTAFGSPDATTYLTLCRNLSYIKLVEKALSGKSSSAKVTINGRIYHLSANPVKTGETGFATVLFAVDVTERETAENMRQEFSANVSHELKTPLTSIMGYAELIKSGFAKKEDVPPFAEKIYAESQRLLSLIQDIIRLSRLDEANVNQNFEKVNLYDTCVSVIDKLSDKAEKANVSISFDGESAVINGYKTVLFEMVYNLCDNAVAYNRENGKVSVTLKKEDGRILLKIADTGIGIAPEYQSRIFERFYCVDKSHSKETGGTGLGLSIVKHAALLHNAEIKLKSAIDKGTEITVLF